MFPVVFRLEERWELRLSRGSQTLTLGIAIPGPHSTLPLPASTGAFLYEVCSRLTY